MALVMATILLLPRVTSGIASNLRMARIERQFMSESLISTGASQVAIEWVLGSLWETANSRICSREKGLALLALGRPEEAIIHLRQAIIDRRDVTTVYWLGMAYDLVGNHEAAVDAWLSVNFQSKAFELADGFLRDGQLDQSGREYELILAASPDSVRALIGLGRIAIYRSNWVEADRLLTRALDLSPSNVEVLVELGRVRFLGQQRQEEAFSLFGLAIRVDPACYWCYLTFADAYTEAGQFSSAVAVLVEAGARASGKDSLLYRALAQLYLENMEQPLEAREICQLGLRQFPNDAYLYYYLGAAEIRLGNIDAARIDLERAVQLDPEVRQFQEALRSIR